MRERIRSQVQVPQNFLTPPVETSQPAEVETAESLEADTAIAILLLDAENLKPDVSVEAFLAKTCTCPLRVKIAFANWRSLGKYDIELHNRHYDLIHVPGGRDMADGKMLIVGSSIRDLYSNVQEVLVCSSDKVMSNLCTKLRQEGLTVFQVQQQGDAITVVNSETGTRAIYSTAQPPAIPSLEDCIVQLKELIRREQQQHGSAWVTLSKISKLFRDQTGVAVSQVVTTHTPGRRARDLFIDHPQDFAIHQPSEQTELYVSLFENAAPVAAKSAPQQSEAHQNGKQPNSQPASNPETTQASVRFQSRSQLEKAIVELVNSLITNSSEGVTDLSAIASQFHVRYRQPITGVINELQIKQRFSTFLKSCTPLLVEQKGKVWEVRLRTR